MAGSVWARNSSRWTRSRTSTAAHTSSVMTSAAWTRCRASDAASSATATIHERRWPLRMPRDSMIMPMPAMATSAPAAWTTAMGRYCAMRWRCGAQRRRHRREQVDRAGHEERDGGEAADAAHADPVGRHLGRGRPRRPARPPGRQLGVDVGRLGAALDHDVGGDEPLAHRRHGQVGLGQHQADVQVRPGLDLEGRLLAVVQERGREPQPAPVLVHHLGGGAGAGEESGVEVGQLGDQRTAGDDARTAPASTAAAGPSSASSPSIVEQGVGDRAGPRAPRPTARAALRRRGPARCRVT